MSSIETVKNPIMLASAVVFALVGIAFLLFIVKRKLGKGDQRSTEPSTFALALAMQTVLQGQLSTEHLGRLIYDALRFGNFRAYRSAFISEKELDTLLGPAEAQNIKAKLQDEQLIKECFDLMRAKFLDHRGTYVEMRPGTKADWRMVMTDESQEIELEVGSMIQGPFGWKILMPPILNRDGF